MPVTPVNQRPGGPLSVISVVSGLTFIQVSITPPIMTRGYSIDHYLIEWNGDRAFTDAATNRSTTQSVAHLSPPLTGTYSGVLLYEISGLTTGQAYWVRVSAHNYLGYGPAQVSPNSVVPAGKPSSPGFVRVSVCPCPPPK